MLRFTLIFSMVLVLTLTFGSITSPAQSSTCLPDCFGNPWGPPVQTNVMISPGCWVTVTWAKRVACGMYYDLHIIQVDALPPSGLYGCSGGGNFAALMDLVTEQMLIMNPMAFPPYIAPNCVDNWRVVKGSCWHWEYATGGIPEGLVGNVDRLVPCEDEVCCLDLYRVCLVDIGGGQTERQVTHLNTRPQEPCPVGPPSQNCFPVCGHGNR